MVEPKSTPRFSSIKSIILTQTDTTVGFLSQNASKLSEIKSRDSSKQFIEVYSTLQALNAAKKRIPPLKRALFRKSKKTTFIVKEKAIRISPTTLHSQVLRNTQWNYSTSANESGKKFDFEFCELKADIIIQDKYGLSEKSPSKLLKINKTKIRRLR